MKDVSELSTTGDGYRLAIHGNLKFAGTVLAAEKVSVRVNFKGLRSLGDVRSLGCGVALGAGATRGLASDHSTSAIS